MNGDYGSAERDEIVSFVPPDVRSVLDVGCAGGGFGLALKRTRPHVTVHGVEPSSTAAALAASRLDRVFEGEFPAAIPRDAASDGYDCITFLDSLEHMIDPWAAVRAARALLGDHGVIVSSIPNVRHAEVVLPLLIKGRFTYADYGPLDRTHLRFFTRSTACALFTESGFEVVGCTPLRWTFGSRWYQLARLLGPLGRDIRTMQYVITARPVSETSA
jgi:2-polyprenyl-3-methyl-5-hydroxy-6-metoxy-1,4-benzoquinol methylase